MRFREFCDELQDATKPHSKPLSAVNQLNAWLAKSPDVKVHNVNYFIVSGTLQTCILIGYDGK